MLQMRLEMPSDLLGRRDRARHDDPKLLLEHAGVQLLDAHIRFVGHVISFQWCTSWITVTRLGAVPKRHCGAARDIDAPGKPAFELVRHIAGRSVRKPDPR